MSDVDKRYSDAMRMLEQYGQDHLLAFYQQLDASVRAVLLDQIEQQDWPQLAELIDSHVTGKPDLGLPERMAPAPYYPYQPGPELSVKYAEARRLGEQMIADGKVAAFTVAGGQGTRLGWDAPKGTYPATPIREAPLFGVFAEYLGKIADTHDRPVCWYIMTSPANDADTRAFFEQHDYFNLNPSDVMFFAQGAVPSFGREGKVLLEAPGRLALNPDGHGGSLRALERSGALDDMARRGIEQISYFQVDNPSVKCIDPLFVGLHALDGAQMSSKMVAKAYATEKLGNFCLADGRMTVIEYSDLPDELAEQRDDDQQLRFRAGSIAIHMIAVAFVRQLNAGGFALPWHRADKKVSHVDPQTGERVDPDGPNAVKLETFVFDALRLCQTSIVYETDRVEEFSPIKNAEGNDSPATSRQLQIERSAGWLESVGVRVPRRDDGMVDAVIEITPATAIEADDLRAVDLPSSVEPHQRLLL